MNPNPRQIGDGSNRTEALSSFYASHPQTLLDRPARALSGAGRKLAWQPILTICQHPRGRPTSAVSRSFSLPLLRTE